MGVWDTIGYFFSADALNPHGMCLFWRPELIWTHAISDIVIGLAYFSIPLAIGVFLYRRPDVRFSWAAWMFVAFILLCGVTHFMMVWTLWNPQYGIEALIKALTAVVSLVTAIALWPLLPKVIAIPSPATLEARIAERDVALAELREAMATMVEMREHDARQKLLLDELNHRVKNTLAAVQSIAVQTLSRAGDIEGAKITFVDRLMALSTTHNLLVKRSWQSALLSELVETTLAPYGKDYVFSGVDLRMSANTAVSMGMALHELATNAVKYGAWSSPNGRVAVDVALGGVLGAATITWTESGGPKIKAPEQRGFGSRLLERGVAAELNGIVEISFRPTGLVCSISVPFSDRLAPLDRAAEVA